MKRKASLMVHIGMLITLCSLLVSTSACSSTQPAQATSSRPNILFLLTDDLNLDEISVMPHLKSLLIDQGVSFSNYFVSVSLCCPSRSTTLRGQYSHNTHVETNGGTNGGFATAHALGLEQSTIGTWLQAAGYRTALIGKYLNGYPNSVSDTYVPPGWNEWDSAAKGNPYSEFNYTLNENGKLVAYGKQAQDYGTDVYAHKASDFITQSAKDHKPFFTYLAVYAPHQPATPAPRDQNAFPGAKAPRTPSYNEADVSDKPQYIRNRPLLNAKQQAQIDQLYRKRLQSLQAVDTAIANLYTTLKTTNQLNNTYIVFTSDNGFHLGQHRLPAGKQTAYEEDIHLPLVVRGPGVPAGKTVDQITGNTDLAPTFADLAGAKAAAFVDGRSFAPLLHTNPYTGTWRQSYLVEHWLQSSKKTQADTSMQEPADQDQNDQANMGKAAKNVVIPEYHGIRIKDYLYVEYSTGERELYNLRNDPAELQNLAATADPALLKRFSERLAALQSCKMSTCRSVEDQTFSVRGKHPGRGGVICSHVMLKAGTKHPQSAACVLPAAAELRAGRAAGERRTEGSASSDSAPYPLHHRSVLDRAHQLTWVSASHRLRGFFAVR